MDRKKEPHDAALIKSIAIKFAFLLMKVMATKQRIQSSK